MDTSTQNVAKEVDNNKDPISEPNPAQAQPTTEGVMVKVVPERRALPGSESSRAFPILVSIRAPSDNDEPGSRAPLDLVAVLDVSGSMSGAKLGLVQDAMRFVINNLGPTDRLSIVTFSNNARKVSSLCRMSDQGREDSIAAVDSLRSENMTNIIAGLTTGLDILETRGPDRNPVSSIILLSDGQDNMNGGGRAFVDALTRIRTRVSVPVHTFGFGTDHDAWALHAITECFSSGGTFSYVESVEAVQEAFARCIGGLLSVVAQETEVSLSSASPGEVRIESISSGRYQSKLDEVSGQAGLIHVGDLYAEEEKKFLVYLTVPKVISSSSSSGAVSTTQLLNVKCSYINPMTKEPVTGETQIVEVRRPMQDDELNQEDREVNLEVDRERNRVSVTEGISKAQEMAENGDLEGAQRMLEERKAMLLASASARAGGDENEVCLRLEDELNEIKERLSSRAVYESEGRGYMLGELSRQRVQRGTTVAAVRIRNKANPRMATGGACPFGTARMQSMVNKAKATKKKKIETKTAGCSDDEQQDDTTATVTATATRASKRRRAQK